MGEYPKRSDLNADDDENKGGTLVEIKQDPRYQPLTRYGEPESPEWYDGKDRYPFWIDEDGNNRIIGYVSSIQTSSETHPHGIMVEVGQLDCGRVQRILVGEEAELYSARFGDRILKDMKSRMTDRDEELLQKFNHESKLFPKSEIPPPPEDLKFEFKASFESPTDKETGIPVSNPTREDMRTNRQMVSNAVAAFANCEGGKLFIGIRDQDGKPVGPESEPAMKMETSEKFDAYKRVIQDSIFDFTKRRTLKIKFLQGEDKEFLVLDIKHDEKPTYVTPHGTEKQDYYIRQDGESVIIVGDEMINHIQKHHPAHFGSKKDTGRWNQNRRNYRR